MPHASLVDLKDPTEDKITFALQDAYATTSQLYTKLGETMMVAVTPQIDALTSQGGGPLDRIASASVQNRWLDEYKKISAPDDTANSSEAPIDTSPPHIFALANAAYLQLKKNRRPQAILFSGNSGTLKSLHMHLSQRYLGTLAGTRHTSKLYRRILAADTLLHIFGDTFHLNEQKSLPPNTPAPNNQRESLFSASTRFVNLVELQFSEKGKIAGCKREAFALDVEKVIAQNPGETTFGVLHVLLNDQQISQSFRTEMHLADNTITYPFITNKFTNHVQLHTPSTIISDNDDFDPKNTLYSPLTFELIKSTMKTLGLNGRYQACIFKTLAGILHLGSIKFVNGLGNQRDACQVENMETLDITARLLGTTSDLLEFALTNSTKRVGKDWCTVLLKASEASKQRDKLARAIYTALFGWLVHFINQRLSRASAVHNIRLIEVPDRPTNYTDVHPSQSYWDFAVSGFVRDKLEAITLDNVFQTSLDTISREVSTSSIVVPEWISRNDVASFYTDPRNGVISAFDEISGRETTADGTMAHDLLEIIERRRESAKEQNGPVFTRVNGITFTVNSGLVTTNKADNCISYNALTFCDSNTENIAVEFVNSFQKGNMSALIEGEDVKQSDFLKMLFSGKVLQELYGEEMAEQWYPTLAQSKSSRRTSNNPSKRKSKAEKKDSPFLLTLLATRLERLQNDLKASVLRFLFCVQHNQDITSSTLDTQRVFAQVGQLQLSAIARWCKTWGGDYVVQYQHDDFLTRYRPLAVSVPTGGATECNTLLETLKLNEAPHKVTVGKNVVLLGQLVWIELETKLRQYEAIHKKDKKASKLLKIRAGDAETLASVADTDDDSGSVADHESVVSVETLSKLTDTDLGSSKPLNAAGEMNRSGDTLVGADAALPEDANVEEIVVTPQRRRWVLITRMLTWWIPKRFMRSCGNMERADIQMAWREKVAICCIIFFCCITQLFVIIVFGRIICPKQNLYNVEELYYKQSDAHPWVGIYGGIYDLNDFYNLGTFHSREVMGMYAGLDITAGFPRTPATYCPYAAKYQPDFPILFDLGTSIANGTFIQSRHAAYYLEDRAKAEYAIDLRLKQFRKKFVGWDPTVVASLAKIKTDDKQRPRVMYIINDIVYDVQPYLDLTIDSSKDFFPVGLFTYIKDKAGTDLSKDVKFMNIWNTDAALRTCWTNLFTVGIADKRKSPQCLITNNVLLAFTILLCAVILIKFLAALMIGGKGEPEDYDKFVVIQVPCYTEGTESMRKTINSLASMTYDDKRKLLFIVCDGNIIGSGNDKPTPRIVLDILGVDPEYDPDPLSFQSIGEAMKQHNMAKIYSGLYEVSGHLVPYIVVVKVGTTRETRRPGNRGKRDSQMILMRLLNKVYFDTPMSPLELELCHQIKNVIGVDPTLYEYCLMVDADTIVSPDSLTRLVGAMVSDVKVMGLCGETRLSNEKDTWATMIQVYEYYISHHLAKAFESLFGSVTCLPGCFCMYRVRSTVKGSPLLVSNALIDDYSVCEVDTLHTKNLLSLGEDRYLTTLMLKHFPTYRTIFTPDAQCETQAPEHWNVLLSQRRRWINSTVHNLVELLDIPQLCGFLCFSMRFVVFLDLVATLVQPGIVGYLAYLIYMAIDSYLSDDDGSFPLVSLILLASVYGVQALIFLIKKEWQHIGWMIIYILAIPVFSFFIPVYSFWHMDDFSWGTTRVVVGESTSKQKVVSTDEKFDLRMIPHKKWKEYEAELMSQYAESMHDDQDLKVHSDYADQITPALGNRNSMWSMAGGKSAGTEMQAKRMTMMSQQNFAFANNANRPMLVASGYTPGADMNRPKSVAIFEPERKSPVTMQAPATPTLQPMAVSPSVPVYTNSSLPSDELIYFEVRRLLGNADLMSITKKQVRDELSTFFAVDLTPKKALINKYIDDIMKEH